MLSYFINVYVGYSDPDTTNKLFAKMFGNFGIVPFVAMPLKGRFVGF